MFNQAGKLNGQPLLGLARKVPEETIGDAGKSIMFLGPLPKNRTLPSRYHCPQAKASRTSETTPSSRLTTTTEPKASNSALNT